MPEGEKPQGKKVLLVGSGGREHAIAWKLAQSPQLEQLFIAPGNPGTAQHGVNVPIPVDDIPGLVNFARQQAVDLVAVGPEIPLTLGLADSLLAAGIRVFGPSAAAARIESSKAFTKEFAKRYFIPTASFQIFDRFEAALHYIEDFSEPFVIKASGLAAGKGVFLPDSEPEARQILEDLMVKGSLGEAGRRVVIEERLVGEEVSLMAFTDGNSLAVMPPAQDHKRLLDGDQGPNTGGMGAFAPVPSCTPDQVAAWTANILQPAVDGLRAEGTPFTGVLYAGLMLTPRGPRLLEFNCRFGDPETQALLPLLESDLLEIMWDCASGLLDPTRVRWKKGSSVCIVLASRGYPVSSGPSVEIHGLQRIPGDTVIFHAGTRADGEKTLTSGGRVLGVTAWAEDLQQACRRVYQAVATVHYEGMQYRHDIAARGLQSLQQAGSAYAAAGVSIDAGSRAVNLMEHAVRSTYTSDVVAGIGSFGGLFDAGRIKSMKHPILAASTDGIGTKVMLGAQLGRYRSLGQDIVNHCIDDILVQGARPLFFLDYFAASCLDPQVTAEIVTGMADACRAAGCVLIGGETAEMPGVYQADEFDVAGTIVGVVERDAVLPRTNLQAGDLLVGVRSSGPHTNGFSLLRRIFADTPLNKPLPGMNETLADALLAPHRSYLPILTPALEDPGAPVKALAHITGGGLLENIPRVLPPGLAARIQLGSWPVPALFQIVQQRGSVAPLEMARVFNLGIGMVIVVSPFMVAHLQNLLPEETWVIGELIPGEKKVIIA